MTLVHFIGGPWHEQVREVDPVTENTVIRPDPDAGACYVVYRSWLPPTDEADREAV